MINWNHRDTVLHAVYELNDQAPGLSHIQAHLGESAPSLEEISSAFNWLGEQELINGPGSWGGGILRARITPLGRNFVETNTSVQELAKAAVQGAIMQNIQNNNNYGGTNANLIGDGNSITQNNNGADAIEKIIAILRDANEVDKADELQQEANQNGVLAALKKAASWITTNVIAAPVIGKIAPIVFSGLGM